MEHEESERDGIKGDPDTRAIMASSESIAEEWKKEDRRGVTLTPNQNRTVL